MDKLTKPSEGFFLAKRRIQDGLAGRIENLEKERSSLRPSESTIDRIREISAEIKALESARDYVRNGLLWDTSEGS